MRRPTRSGVVNPNEQLVSQRQISLRATALDVGAGEAADAIWLAERGWRVTVVDISTCGSGAGCQTSRGDW